MQARQPQAYFPEHCDMLKTEDMRANKSMVHVDSSIHMRKTLMVLLQYGCDVIHTGDGRMEEEGYS